MILPSKLELCLTMSRCYFELRTQSAKGTDSIAADMMRHLHTRQHLGKVVVICEQPLALLASARKQWLKLSRVIQKQRASTLNADKILKYTHTIAHMQHMRFSNKAPLEDPEADVYFLEADSSQILPLQCFTMYSINLNISRHALSMIAQLPDEALIVDYTQALPWDEFGLQPKTMLEHEVATSWRRVHAFLISRDIVIGELIKDGLHNVEAMDDALDSLLSVSGKFLNVANNFQHAWELSRPIRIKQHIRQEYDSLVLLAYRVQALSPGAFTQRFLESYNEDDTFFLYDTYKRQFVAPTESLQEAVERHTAAGRPHLALALRYTYAK